MAGVPRDPRGLSAAPHQEPRSIGIDANAAPLSERPSLGPVWALAFLAGLVALPYAVPERFTTVRLPGGRVVGLRLLSPPPASSVPVDAAEPEVEPTVGAVPVQAAAVVETPEEPAPTRRSGGLVVAPEEEGKPPPVGDAQRMLVDPTGHAFDPLFEAFRKVEKKEPGSRARISYYGDSIVAFDLVTSTLRRRMSDRFGDAGHGFVLPADAWTGYHQHDVARFSSSNWMVSRVTGPLTADGRYGLGGVSFQGEEAIALVGTARGGAYGTKASRFVVSYAAQPLGGELIVKIDGVTKERVATGAPEVATRTVEIEVDDGPHLVDIRSHRGPVRLFGVEILRSEPGTVVDALGIMSSRLWQIERWDQTAWAEEIARVRPAMLVLAVATNDVSDGVRGAKVFDRYEAIAEGMVKRFRAAAPWATCLVVGPLDRGSGAADPYTNKGVAGRVNGVLKRLALAEGCAFWDVYNFMGGQGGMAVWARSGLGDMDHMHPSPRGAQLLGDSLMDELMRRYAAWGATPP